MTEAESEREKLREDSEARDIIHDVNSLVNKGELAKTRWVWELLQNAKDAAPVDGVDVMFQLLPDKIIISHNGTPFETKHLIAILHKKSTKSLGKDDGTTGKYGTGFVTTHILSKRLTISGIHRNDTGERLFEIEVDRSSVSLKDTEALENMKASIKSTFDQINRINNLPPKVFDQYNHTFTYFLNSNSKQYASSGLDELEKNVMFTLLINSGDDCRKRINSITISRFGSSRKYSIHSESTTIPGINYLNVQENRGLLYSKLDDVILGMPVLRLGEKYSLLGLEGQAVLFKEFPLIGTEDFNLPIFIQHNNFIPTEPRDGIVTRKEDEELMEFIPDSNRQCLRECRDHYVTFLASLIDAEVANLHYLALSGLPLESNSLTGKEWYISEIQSPIRDFLRSRRLVATVSGLLIKIEQARFPPIEEVENDSFYDVLAGIIPKQIPDGHSIKFWSQVVSQQPASWPENISISLEPLLEALPNLINVEETIPFDSLLLVYQYLHSIKSSLGETYPIYLNEKNEFRVKGQVRLYPAIANEIKFVSRQLGRDLDLEFLNKGLGDGVPGIDYFNLEQFYKDLNNDLISKVPVDACTEEQISGILHVNTLFKTDRASKRELWLDIVNELLRGRLGKKRYIVIDYENYYQPAELWTAKYICYLIEKEMKFSKFTHIYFNGNSELAYDWLNKFLNYLNESREDIKSFLGKYNVIPTQHDGIFKAYSDDLFREDNPEYFDLELKKIVKDKCQFVAEEYLISNEVKVDDFRATNVDFITKHIDKLFEDDKIGSKVGLAGELHDVFNTVNSWFDKHSDAASYLKTFASKRNYLYVISLGDGFSKQIKALKDSGKSMEDISKLAEINLSIEDIKRYEEVVNELGSDALISKAKEMIAVREQRLRWKKIGKSAEDAFKKVFKDIKLDMDLSNPDIGKDFEIILKTKGYSIEIKNVISGKENVNMSILQGRTAVLEKDRYALCVLTRPDDETLIDEVYFRETAKFVTDIGYQIGDKINNWECGLFKLNLSDDIKVSLENKTESVYVNRPIWRKGKHFSEFIEDLKAYFEVNN